MQCRDQARTDWLLRMKRLRARTQYSFGELYFQNGTRNKFVELRMPIRHLLSCICRFGKGLNPESDSDRYTYLEALINSARGEAFHALARPPCWTTEHLRTRQVSDCFLASRERNSNKERIHA